ncbi:MAG TPA: hypothetical protein VJU84_18160 [Pyrinomonadaceae bacterium]|nr:hypothetical protein [Pyrinomonadaceae bacterium]
MLTQIDKHILTEILARVERAYTSFGWDGAARQSYIEGAVVDEVHHQLFNGEVPVEFAAASIYDRTEDPRKTLTKRRRQEIKNLLQRNWQGPGGVILAEKMIDETVSKVIDHHKQSHSQSSD